MSSRASTNENRSGTVEPCAVWQSSPVPHPLPPTLLLLLLDPPASGAWNMAVDEALLEAAAEEGLCALRFYQWSEPTLSLGYFQAYADREKHAASRGCAVVRRASGGGAILHDFDLTYSLALPERHPLARDRLWAYRVVHDALIEVLGRWGVEARLFAPCSCKPSPLAPLPKGEGSHPGTPARESPFLCFQRRSPGDVLIGSEKIAGSAQRRRRGAVLQHGSVLLARSPAAPELLGLKELAGRSISVEEFQGAWVQRMAGAIALTWRQVELPEALRRRAALLAEERYAAPAWTQAR